MKHSSTSPLKVLVVDDDPVVTLYLVETLADMGHTVVGTAQVGGEAVEMALNRVPDLVLMDIQLRGAINGIAAARRIKETQNVAILFITAHKKDAYLEEAKQLNPDGFLCKPISGWQLKSSIEIAMHKHAFDEKLKESKVELETRVRARTAELEAANQKLRQLIHEHIASEAELKSKTEDLNELNAALKNLLQMRDQDRREMENRILVNVRLGVYPHLERLKQAQLKKGPDVHVRAMESNLDALISPFIHKLSRNFSVLSPTEIQVSKHIRNGKTTKEIAVLMGLAKTTIDTHRNNIRKKLGLEHQKKNLRAHLLAMENDISFDVQRKLYKH